MKSIILLVKKLLRQAEVTSGLVNASFSLPEWPAFSLHAAFMFICRRKPRGGGLPNETDGDARRLA